MVSLFCIILLFHLTIPYFIQSKTSSIKRCTIILSSKRKEKCYQLNYNVMVFYHLECKHSIFVLLVLIRHIFHRLFCTCIKKENSNKKDWLRYPTISYLKPTHLKLLFKFVVTKVIFFSHNISVCSFKPLI